jgi:hypothetical protein
MARSASVSASALLLIAAMSMVSAQVRVTRFASRTFMARVNNVLAFLCGDFP